MRTTLEVALRYVTLRARPILVDGYGLSYLGWGFRVNAVPCSRWNSGRTYTPTATARLS